MKKEKDYTIPLLIWLFLILLFTSCKKDNKQPSVTQPVTPLITVNSTTISITTKEYCNKLQALPNIMISFYYDKAQSDTALPVFTVITDTLGLAKVIGKEARTYYYRYTGYMTGSCRKYFAVTGNLIVNKGWETKFDILED